MTLLDPASLSRSFLSLSLTLLGAAAPGCADTSSDLSDDSGSSTSADASESTTDAPATDGTDDETGSEGTTAGDTGAEPSCGNGLVDADEECDDGNLAGGTCEGFGFDGGTLACDAACRYDLGDCHTLPAAPVLQLGVSPIKQLDVRWAAVDEAEHYRLFESSAPGEPFRPLGGELTGESTSLTVPLYLALEARYILQACNALGCTNSSPVSVAGSLAEAVGYVKASNPDREDGFGFSVALSGDGNTLAVGAREEDGGATGIGGDEDDDTAHRAGAVYVLVRDPNTNEWSQEEYVKASNADRVHEFGFSVALSGDGHTLAVGAVGEPSRARGIGGDQTDDSAVQAGAVYLFVRNPSTREWSQKAYVKASNTGAYDSFGRSVALSDDGDTFAVGAPGEDSGARGIDSDQRDDGSTDSGAVYVFARSGAGTWSQQAYIKASNAEPFDELGDFVALSGDGDTLAVSALGEDGGASGIDGDQASNDAMSSGAVYVFVRSGTGTWSQQAYVKGHEPAAGDWFGREVALSRDGSTLAVGAEGDGDDVVYSSGAAYVFVRSGGGTWSQQAHLRAAEPDMHDDFGCSIALSGDGHTLAVGAREERGGAAGIGGDQTDDSVDGSGAAYVFVRSEAGAWSQRAYVKASNPDVGDSFGRAVALSDDGRTLAVSAEWEDGGTAGISGNQADDSQINAGAVYLY